jgi:hypothetical protein
MCQSRVTSNGHCSLILSQQQQHAPRNYSRSPTGSATCPMLMRRSRMFQEYSFEKKAVCWEIWGILAKCSIQTLAACLYLLWEICVKSNNTVFRML